MIYLAVSKFVCSDSETLTLLFFFARCVDAKAIPPELNAKYHNLRVFITKHFVLVLVLVLVLVSYDIKI